VKQHFAYTRSGPALWGRGEGGNCCSL